MTVDTFKRTKRILVPLGKLNQGKSALAYRDGTAGEKSGFRQVNPGLGFYQGVILTTEQVNADLLSA